MENNELRLSHKFTLAFIAAGILPLLAMALLAFDFSRRAIGDQVAGQLVGVARVQTNRIQLLSRLKRDQMRLISSRTQLRSLFVEWLSEPTDQAVAEMVQILRDARDEGADQISVLRTDGEVVASTDETWSERGSPADEALLERAQNQVVFGELFLDAEQRICVDMYGPLLDRSKQVIGLIWVRTPLRELASIAGDYTGLGASGETLLVKLQPEGTLTYLTPQRFEADSTGRNDSLLAAMRGDRLKAIETIDYRGERVLAAASYSEDLDLGVIVKIDRREALSPANRFGQMAIWGVVFASLSVVAVALILSGSITRPLKQLTEAVDDFQDGDAFQQLDLSSQHEVGTLGRALSSMAGRLAGTRRELEKESAFRRLVLDSAHDAIVSVNGDGRVKLWNPRARTMFGWREDECLGRELSEVLKVDDGESPWHALLREVNAAGSASGEPLPRQEHRIRRRDGSAVDVQVAASSMRVETQTEYCLFIQEVTKQKDAERRLKRLNAELKAKNEEIQQLVYTVSHDLKSPLVTCKGFIGVLRDDLEREAYDEMLDSMDRILRAAHRMDRLIDDLLNISRIGTIPISHEWIEAGELFRTLVDDWQMQIENAKVEVTIAEDMPRLWADRVQAMTVFENLLANALKHGAKGEQPIIGVGGVEIDGEARFYFADNGPGIAPEFHDKIFRLFQRLDSVVPGSGVGLAAVTRIMEVHGGHAWVESVLGQGATFWVAFPRPAGDNNEQLEDEAHGKSATGARETTSPSRGVP